MNWKPFALCLSYVLELEPCSVPIEAKIIGLTNVWNTILPRCDWESGHHFWHVHIVGSVSADPLSPSCLGTGQCLHTHMLITSAAPGAVSEQLSSLDLQSVAPATGPIMGPREALLDCPPVSHCPQVFVRQPTVLGYLSLVSQKLLPYIAEVLVALSRRVDPFSFQSASAF